MEKQKKPIHYSSSHSTTSWILSGFLISVGIIGLQLSTDPSILNLFRNNIPHPAYAVPMEDHPEIANSSKDLLIRPYAPQILAPAQGAHFFSGNQERAEVTLRWSPIDAHLKPELQMRRFEDPDFNFKVDLTLSGAVIHLPDGTYDWKIRTFDSVRTFSEWSSTREFIVQEASRGTLSKSSNHPLQE